MKQNDFFQKNPQNMPTSLHYFRPKWFHLRKVKFKNVIKKWLNPAVKKIEKNKAKKGVFAEKKT